MRESANLAARFAADALADQQASRLAHQHNGHRGQQQPDEDRGRPVDRRHTQAVAEVHAQGREYQADQRRGVLRNHRISGGVLAQVQRAPEGTPLVVPPELPKREQEAAALETEGDAEHQIVPARILHRHRMTNVLHAFVERDTSTQTEDQHGHDQAPEIQLLAMTEGMLFGGRPLAEAQPGQQQYPIEAVDR